MQDEIGIEAIINRLPLQPGDVNKTCADTTKIDFKFGIKNFISWYKEYNK